MKPPSFISQNELEFLCVDSYFLLSPRYQSFGPGFARYGACHRKSREIDLSYCVGRLLRFFLRPFAENICDLFIYDWRWASEAELTELYQAVAPRHQVDPLQVDSGLAMR